MKLKNIYLLLFAMILLSSCKQNDFMVYNSESYIYFGPTPDFTYKPSYSLKDTVKTYTFYYENEDVTQQTVYFDIYTIGGPRDYDREFVLKQVQINGDNINNAVAGTNYIAFDSPEMKTKLVFKAGEVHYKVPIIVKRGAKDDSNVYTLKFTVEENEHFKLGDEKQLWRRLEFTSDLQRPNAWDYIIEDYYFGEYSKTKHKFMIEASKDRGYKWDEECFIEVNKDEAELDFWKAFFSSELKKLNENSSDDLKDENGEYVTFPE